MRTLQTLASKVQNILFQGKQNLQAWGQVATQPKLRQEYKETVLGVKPQKLLSPLAPTPTPTPDIWKKARDLGWKVSTPTPTTTPMQPTEQPTATPTTQPMPTMQPIPTATPTPIPLHIKEIPYEERPYHEEILATWGDDASTAHDILRYVDEAGEVKGENTSYGVGLEMDVANRINPETGEWDPDAPIKTFTNPFTNEEEDSVDRGLFRINNETFYDYQRRFSELLEKNGITEWDDMLDTGKNIIMAWIIFTKQKEAWYAAKPTTGARL